ncbi:MAG TPA: MFS transporter [Dehalococcoidia bacterium]|nr:MFS transporter [Dehalococcoidia bacterium]
MWCGQLVSTIGGQMQQVAIAWHLYNLTGSSFQVGLVAFFGIAPFLFLSLVGGALADQFDRKRILLVTQTATMLVSSLLVIATVAHVITPTMIFAISFLSGMTRAFDAPARQSMIPNLVPPNELANALTLNTMLRQLGTIAGPGLGGLILGFFGVGVTYALNTISFLGIISALLIMDPLPPIKRVTQPGWQLALGGFRFVKSEPVVLSLLMLDFVANIFGALRSLFPAFAADVLDVGPQELGLLYSAPAAGAVTGALLLGWMGSRTRHPALILAIVAAFGLFTAGFGFSRTLPMALVMLFGTGLADVIGEVIRSTIVQLRTPDELRGRVTSLTVVFTGGGPQVGQLQAGALASALGPAEAAIIGGGAVLASALAFCLNPHMRRLPAAPDLAAQTVAANSS